MYEVNTIFDICDTKLEELFTVTNKILHDIKS